MSRDATETLPNTVVEASSSSTSAIAPVAADDQSHVHYNLEANTPPRRGSSSVVGGAAATPGASLSRSDTELQVPPILWRRTTRAATFKNIDEFDEFNPNRPGWQPGAEPGFDPTKPDGGHASMPTLSAPCEITVVDFSEDDMAIHQFENSRFIAFLEELQPAWSKCRWINVNGLSWDVIQALGRSKRLHSLALEDIMNTRNRTKADWYPNHAFIVLTLQKLVQLVDPDDSNDRSSARTSHSTKSIAKKARSLFGAGGRRDSASDPETSKPSNGGQLPSVPTGFSDAPGMSMIRTLQQYQASPNDARTDFMERHSPLTPRNMAVSAEQVSLFLCSDNTVISFFEMSADDVERPIVKRLGRSGTILRESCDASLLVQAILDAIVDLAIPLTAVYNDVIGDLELDVLTSPSVKQSRQLYIVISEINKMLTFLNPVDNLVNVLRDRKTSLSQDEAKKYLQDAAAGVIITPQTHTYLGDVLDHTIMVVEAFVQMKQSADNLIGLIFNTITSAQNETMKLLTSATIVFLPMTFVTGYFGMNFEPFNVLQEDVPYFWKIAVPTLFGTVVLLMWPMISSWVQATAQRRHYLSIKSKNAKRKQNMRH